MAPKNRQNRFSIHRIYNDLKSAAIKICTWHNRINCYPYIKFQKFDAFMPNMHNISILNTFQKLLLKIYSLAEAYPQSAMSGLKGKSKYAITD